jgi:hypothetical protein
LARNKNHAKGSELYINDQFCAEIPNNIDGWSWVTVECETPISGDQVTLKRKGEYLKFCGIEVFG